MLGFESLTSEPPTPAASQVAYAIRTGRNAFVAVYVIQVYEWLLNLGDEYTLIHQTPWSSVKVTYLVCRYYPLLLFPFQLWGWMGDHVLRVCQRVIHPLFATLVPLQLSAQAVILTRAYVFTGRKKRVLVAFALGYLTLLGSEIWIFGFDFSLIPPADSRRIIGNTGCFGNDSIANRGGPDTRPALLFLFTFILDAIAMSLVLFHARRVRAVDGKLGRYFVFQGLLNFSLMSILNLFTASFYFMPEVTLNGHGLPFSLILSDVFACRLILDLRRSAASTETMDLEEQSRIVRVGLRRLHDRECGQDTCSS
ncbi:hypothetical protein BJ138DRAFT_779044 [Hygrophoropsis aurantiaca]|uniref:Uncharacterized protein n=1 Tax=Hygrophoropsis aurantiaca TaxID=72124 RepID=A0ACB8AI14_9AGAM|nr:hypothetical protein BJ138DRAFT_779044 [Hygrophoropsis aurantiaca]